MDSMPKDAGIVRIHVAGDFFNSDYMWAWWLTASENPDTRYSMPTQKAYAIGYDVVLNKCLS